MNFFVELDQYRGPLDLLLYLVRREELDLATMSISSVTRQFLDSLELLTELNLDDIAEFLEVAGLLIEMKAKLVLPQEPQAAAEESEERIEEAPDQLVQKLLEYKRIRDAASILDEQSRLWQLRYARQSNDLPVRRVDPGEQPIADLEVWDLVSAFGRILREKNVTPTATVVYDDTPIHVYMQRIHSLVRERGRVELMSLFEVGKHKSALVALFLATLELTRHHGLRTEQESPEASLWLTAGPNFTSELDVAEVENLSSAKVEASNLPVRPR